jgi:hypothetical protein
MSDVNELDLSFQNNFSDMPSEDKQVPQLEPNILECPQGTFWHLN